MWTITINMDPDLLFFRRGTISGLYAGTQTAEAKFRDRSVHPHRPGILLAPRPLGIITLAQLTRSRIWRRTQLTQHKKPKACSFSTRSKPTEIRDCRFLRDRALKHKRREAQYRCVTGPRLGAEYRAEGLVHQSCRELFGTRPRGWGSGSGPIQSADASARWQLANNLLLTRGVGSGRFLFHNYRKFVPRRGLGGHTLSGGLSCRKCMLGQNIRV